MRIPFEKFQMVGRDKIKCWLPKYTGKAMLNLWCHDLCLDRRGKGIKTEIFFDGVRYVSDEENFFDKEKVTSNDLTRPEVEAKQKWRPDGDVLSFTLSDYIFHELATGISLSIEITAALMELHPTIRDAALEAFFKKGLAEVTRSNLLYTRIAVARSFFYQIHLEWQKNKLAANNAYEMPIEDSTMPWNFPSIGVDFEDAVDYACQDLKILDQSEEINQLDNGLVYIEPTEQIPIEGEEWVIARKMYQNWAERNEAPAPWIEAKDSDCTDLWLHTRVWSILYGYEPEDGDDLEGIIRYYEGLLKMVEYPLDIEKWRKESPLNLALFVQPKHNNVPIILDYLKTGSMRKGPIRAASESWEEPPCYVPGFQQNLYRLLQKSPWQSTGSLCRIDQYELNLNEVKAGSRMWACFVLCKPLA